jgi:hypothetical protein
MLPLPAHAVGRPILLADLLFTLSLVSTRSAAFALLCYVACPVKLDISFLLFDLD